MIAESDQNMEGLKCKFNLFIKVTFNLTATTVANNSRQVIEISSLGHMLDLLIVDEFSPGLSLEKARQILSTSVDSLSRTYRLQWC